MSAALWNVSRFGVPPSIGITYTSVLPVYWPLNAIHLPSGEIDGLVSSPGEVVSRRAIPPLRSTIQMSWA